MYRIFLSTLSLRRATPDGTITDTFFGISIHALLAESDQKHKKSPCKALISIHALLAESDRISQRDKLQDSNFYPRSPCGERRSLIVDCTAC